MSFLNNMPVKAKLLCGFMAVLIIFVIVSLMSILYINTTNATIERVNHVVANRMDNISQIQNNAMAGDFVFAEVLTAFKDTPSDRQRYVNELDKIVANIDKAKSQIVLQGNADNVAILRIIVNQSTAWTQVYRNQMRDALLNGTFEKISEIYAQGLSSAYLELSQQSNLLNKRYRQEVIDSTTVLANDNTFYYIIMGTILATFFSIFIALWFASLIVSQLNYCIKHANAIANGDFSQNIESKSTDEFGKLMSAFALMRSNLNRTISNIINSTNHVVEKVKVIQNLNHTIAKDIANNDNNAITVATAVNEMVSTTGNIAASCEGAATSSDKSRQSTDQGMQSVKQAIERVKLQSDRTHEDAKNLETLSEQTQKIGFIVNTIDDIANQTNLLALNAAIEAARAGEVGRGFAVVADEVRALASRTTNSTSEIKAMVQSIQDSAKTSVESMNLSVENIGELAASADLLENVFDEVIANVEQVNTQVTQIAAAAEEQTAATGEISQNMHNISDASHKIASLANDGLQQLDEMTSDLLEIQKSMGIFKLSSDISEAFIHAETNIYPAGAAARSFVSGTASSSSHVGQASPAYATVAERH